MKIFVILLALCASVHATEYFVAHDGRDSAFKTIGEGVKALKPGDTLTIMPGEYFESIQTAISGTPEAPITIRAWRAGTVLIRGDVDLGEFKPAAGLRNVFVTEFKKRAESVAERSTWRMLQPKLSLPEVELALGSYLQDEKAGRLYVHTTDSLPPRAHAMSSSVTNGFGMVFDGGKSPVQNITVDGLAITGFSHRDYDLQHGARTRWGLMFKNATNVTIRRCTAFLNSGGIHLSTGGKGCVVEECRAFGNWSRYVDIGNNINGWGVSGATFRNNVVEGFPSDPNSSRFDITFYSGGSGCVMENNTAINAGLMVKGGFDDAVQRGNITVGHKFYRKPDSTNLELLGARTAKDEGRFADVVNHDYRPQDGSAGIFYVSPKGDDTAAGTTLKTAWRTLARAAKALQPGQTLYLSAGEYAEPLAVTQRGTSEKVIHFLRHGHDRVVVKYVALGGSHLHVNGLEVREEIRGADGENVRVENCLASGAVFEKVRGVQFEHNLLRDASLRLVDSPEATVSSNVFGKGARLTADKASQTGLWSDANASGDLEGLGIGADYVLKSNSPLIGHGSMASTIGPFLRLAVKRPLPIENVTVHDVTDTTVTAEWWTPTQNAESALEWGPDEACANKLESTRGSFHTATMSRLKPGTVYYFRASSRAADEERVFATHTISRPSGASATAAQVVKTATRCDPPRILHVAMNGDDAHDGLSTDQAWRTLSHAADLARAGDTVMIHAGTYEETVYMRSSGEDGAPITFRAAPGEVVWMDGSSRFRSTAFRLLNKNSICLDGLRFHHFRFGPDEGPIIDIRGGSHHIIRRCFHDGRELDGYVGTLVGANECDHLLIENTVMINGMNEGIAASRCPDITVRHCVFYDNFIRAMTAWQFEPKLLVHLSHNLICDNLPRKVHNALFRVSHLDGLRSDDNVIYSRIDGALRPIVETADINGKRVGHQDPGSYRGENLFLADVQKLVSQEKETRCGNPGIAVANHLVPPDARPQEWSKVELHREGDTFAPLDFKDFIPAADNPLAKAKDGEAVGLEPGAFK